MSEELYQQLFGALQNRQLVALATIIAGPTTAIGHKLLLWPTGTMTGTLGSEALDQQVWERSAMPFARQEATRFTLATPQGEIEIFLEIHAPPAKLIIVGAVHMAIPLVTFANTLGFETIVLDARSAFATEERFHHADQLIIRWPADALAEMALDEATYLVFLTHDEKIDNPALQVALASRARYIGALGSRKTHARRVERLLEMGVEEAAMARIHAPVGLMIGARQPEEIALAIVGEIVTVMRQ